ncbi:hypothetical protein TI39_contig5844g00009 [Zymoseptoria brevis]|uniref:Uncharacterized protein n=1 Tax=Zymoseptoria brevis TaxID=1047168 RepID=A0A0F4G591_9PEZI|nr:hypothetical protein TI39_contig5844g00009 [Zymoseptoria brevis]
MAKKKSKSASQPVRARVEKKNPSKPMPLARPAATLIGLPTELLLEILDKTLYEKHLFNIAEPNVYLTNSELHGTAKSECPATTRFFVRGSGSLQMYDFTFDRLWAFLAKPSLTNAFARITSLRVILHVHKESKRYEDDTILAKAMFRRQFVRAGTPEGSIHFEETETKLFKKYEKLLN